MKRYVQIFSALFLVLFLPGCYFIQIVSPELMPSSENAYFTESGRLFVVGGKNLYEVTISNGTYSTRVELEGLIGGYDCHFNGMTAHGETLYALCSSTSGEPIAERSDYSESEIENIAQEGGEGLFEMIAGLFGIELPKVSFLVRIDLKEAGPHRVKYSEISKGGGVFFPNGITTDGVGNIYITNFLALISNEPAILKVKVEDEENFIVSEEPFLQRPYGIEPNGIQLDGDVLYYVSGNNLFRIGINDDGSAGHVASIYSTFPTNVFDDFIIGPDGIALTELNMVTIVSPLAAANKIILFRREGNSFKKYCSAVCQKELRPSSIALPPGDTILNGDLYITDFFGGGIYKRNHSRVK